MWSQTSLAGKRVLVTAGGDGIGLEIVHAFTEAGVKVLVCDIRPQSLERAISPIWCCLPPAIWRATSPDRSLSWMA